MATWIAHLRIAENLLERIPNLDAAQFAIGSLAPDSGVPDEKWEHFDPPKEVTHFLRNGTSESHIHDLLFYHQHLKHISPQDVSRFSLRLGYFFHLLADGLWSRQIGPPLKARFAEELKKTGFIWEVKQDWYGLDLIHVRDTPNSLFWRVFLQAEPTAFDLNYLPKHALEHQLNYIKTFYQRTDDDIIAMYNRPYIYLSQTEMDSFVSNASHTIYQAYQLLWPNPPDLNNKNSMLEIVSF